MVRTNDGFEIAEADLKLRGPYLCNAKSQQGRLAERLGSGLQNRVQQFKSATDLHFKIAII